MISDLKQSDLHVLLTHLDRLDRIAEPLLPGTRVAKPTPLKLIIFSSRSDLRRSLGTSRYAGVMQPSLKTHRLLIGPDRRGILETAQHEYAHYLLRNRLDVSLPIWFDEGLASLLGAVRFDHDSALIGELPRKRLNGLFDRDPLRKTRPLTLGGTLAADNISDWPRERLNRFYDWSWLLTHYLYFPTVRLGQDTRSAPDTRAMLTTYLADRGGSLPDYLDTSLPDLQRALERHLQTFSAPSQAPSAEETSIQSAPNRCLNELERDFELAQATLSHNPKNALRLLEPHLLARPGDPELLIAKSRAQAALGESSIALSLAEEAYESGHTEDSEQTMAGTRNHNAMVNLADRLVDECLQKDTDTCRAAWRRAASLYRASLREDPERIDAVFGLGLSYLHSGRPGDAVNYLQVTYQHAPWASVVNFYLGESYRLIGDTRAHIYLINARNWAPDLFWQKLAELALARLRTAEISDQ